MDNAACFEDMKNVALLFWMYNGSLFCIFLTSVVSVMLSPDSPFLLLLQGGKNAASFSL